MLRRLGEGWLSGYRFVRWFTQYRPGPTASLENGLPVVALVGRPNVGKSALFNRLIHRREAMVKNTPESHVTRDYRCGIAKLGDLLFTVVDTSGLEPSSHSSGIQARATEITRRLMQRVDLTLFMMDAREQLTVMDEDVAAWIRNLVQDPTKLLLVANKCEALATNSSNSMEEIRDHLMDAYRLGMGSPISISAETGDGMIDLCEALIPLIQTPETPSDSPKDTEPPKSGGEAEKEEIREEPIKVAIMGLPNVGKSTLMNQLVQYERSLCGPEIGLTRDPVAETLTLHGRQIQLIDTAGWMKFFSCDQMDDADGKLAKEAYYAAKKVLNFAHVVVVMLDVAHAVQHDSVFFRQELQLASAVLKEKRVLIIAMNKMDILDAERQKLLEQDIVKKISDRFYEVDNLVCLPISAKTGHGVERLIPEIIQKSDKWNTKIKTSVLNDWFAEMSSVQRLAKFSDSALRRIKFLSQTKIRPPTFCLRVSGRIPFTDVEKRTFINALRESFDFRGVPLRVVVKYGTSWDVAKKRIAAKQTRLTQSAA